MVAGDQRPLPVEEVVVLMGVGEVLDLADLRLLLAVGDRFGPPLADRFQRLGGGKGRATMEMVLRTPREHTRGCKNWDRTSILGQLLTRHTAEQPESKRKRSQCSDGRLQETNAERYFSASAACPRPGRFASTLIAQYTCDPTWISRRLEVAASVGLEVLRLGRRRTRCRLPSGGL